MSMSPARYGLSLRITHWATVVAVLAAYLFANMGEGSEEGGVATSGMQAMQWHYVAGIIV